MYLCFFFQIESVLHEMYHTIGANHEIQRLDRSNHVNVLWNNIFPSNMKQFAVTRETRDRFPYDYHSVMQYRLSVRTGFISPFFCYILLSLSNFLSLSLSLSQSLYLLLWTHYWSYFQTLSKSSGLNSISLKRPELSYLATFPKYGFSFLDIADINDAYQCTGQLYHFNPNKFASASMLTIQCYVFKLKFEKYKSVSTCMYKVNMTEVLHYCNSIERQSLISDEPFT